MGLFIAVAFIAGLVLAFVFFARPAKALVKNHSEDLQAAKRLLDEAQIERERLKQQVADLTYKLGELEKDLASAQRAN